MIGAAKKGGVRMSKTGDGMVNEAGQPYGELIREYRKRKGLSQEQLGQLLNVKKNAVGAWEAGRSRPDVAGIPVLCRELSLPIKTFFGLSGEEDSCEEVTARYALLNDYNRQIVLNQMDMLYDMQCQQPRSETRKLVQVYRNDLTAAAGYSYTIGEGSGETVYLAADPVTVRADEIIRVSGDSMEPSFFNGDQVLVQHCKSLREGEIGIFTNGDTGYIKEYRKDGLYSHNPAYPVMHFSEDDQVRCIGRVLGRLRTEQMARADEIAAWTGSAMRG